MNEEITLLILAKMENSITQADKDKLKTWIEESEANKLQYIKIKETWLKSGSVSHLMSVNLNKDWLQVKTQLKPDSKSTWHRWAMAASLALIVGLSVIFYNSNKSNKVSNQIAAEFSANQNPKTITLIDGTVVTLDANSNLAVNAHYGTKNREVKLSGEAFFEVTRNTALPFVVLAGNSTTKVLGTAFNVENINKTATIQVHHGKVSFGREKNNLFLEKDMAARLDSDGTLRLIKPDLNMTAWKTGVLKFKNEPISEVINVLNNHFKVIIYTEDTLSERRLTATFDHLKIEEILVEICLIHQLSYQKTSQGFIIKKK